MRLCFNLVLIKKGNWSDIDLIKQNLDRPRLDHKKIVFAQNLGQSHKILILPNLDQSRDLLLNFTIIIVQNSADATIASYGAVHKGRRHFSLGPSNYPQCRSLGPCSCNVKDTS